MSTSLKAQWSKLNSGEWGAKVFFDGPFDSVEAGDLITIVNKKGEETEAAITRVLWTGDDAVRPGARSSLVAIKKIDA
jgi:hypothetical protein